MDKDTNFDVPVFISQPEKIKENDVVNDNLYKLKNISVIKMYEYEVFSNYENIYISDYELNLRYLILILFFMTLIFLFFST
jgi:hypothetical protein